MSGGIVVADSPPSDWDVRTVDSAGGHVLQSAAWAEHWRLAGRLPLFLAFDEARILALTRPWPVGSGAAAYLSRGPVPSVDGEALGRQLATATAILAERGIDVIAADPEVPESDQAYAEALAVAGFRRIEELQPTRHRLTVPLAGSDEVAAFDHLSRSTRQRIRQAEKLIDVVRYDLSSEATTGDGFARPARDADAALRWFHDALVETGRRRAFSPGPASHWVSWWTRALSAGHLIYLEAHDASTGEPLAGLVLYRHGRRLSTAHSADRTGARTGHPGAMHLLRWRAIQLAIQEGRDELDMGGVDLKGARREPREGEPTYGLFMHKLSFGASWVALRGNHEKIIRPGRYFAGRVIRRLLSRP